MLRESAQNLKGEKKEPIGCARARKHTHTDIPACIYRERWEINDERQQPIMKRRTTYRYMYIDI